MLRRVEVGGGRVTSRRKLGSVAAVVLAQALLVAAAAFVIAWSGVYNVAATAGHWNITRWFVHFAMRRSVAFHAPEMIPPKLDNPILIMRGAAHFRSECQSCHGAPSGGSSAIATAMTPPPPRLDDAVRVFSPSQLHWIVKHGIKMTAMPAWPAPERDDEIWSMVAFLTALPTMTPEQYRHLAGNDLDGRSPFATEKSPDALRASRVAATCGSCHGVDGQGRDGAFPKIAGLDFNYIVQSLREFRTGTRKSGFMQPVAARMSDADFLDAATYFAGQERQSNMREESSAQLVREGQRIAEPAASARGSPACLGCHLPDHEKRNPQVPSLASQNPEYLAEQLHLYRSGIRSGTPNARTMARYARELSDDDIKAVANYLGALSSPSRHDH